MVIPEELEISFTTAFPCLEAEVKGATAAEPLPCGSLSLFVRPMGAEVHISKLTAGIYRVSEDGREELVQTVASLVKNNVPSALWASEAYREELVRDVVSGITCRAKPSAFELFPKNSYLSEEVLSETNARRQEDAFDFSNTWTLPEYQIEETIQIVADTADRLKTEGKQFLAAMGYQGECDLSVFAQYADSLLDEDVFVGGIV